MNNVGAGETITINATGTLTLLTNLPNIGKNMTIAGPTTGTFTINATCLFCSGFVIVGPAVTSVSISDVTITGANNSGIFHSNGALTLTRVVLSGNGGGSGAGLRSANFLSGTTPSSVLNQVSIINNTAFADGGGISTTYPITINDSIIRGNKSPAQAAGINTGSVGLVFPNNPIRINIDRSEISGNQIVGSNGAGGIFVCGLCAATITNSTIAGNSGLEVGAVWADGPVTLSSDTIASNTLNPCNACVQNAAGISTDFFPLAVFTLQNTILANNVGGTGNCKLTTVGTITSSGNNHSTDASCAALTAAGDVANTPLTLGSLQNNGGPTQTMALALGNPAVDTGSNTGCAALPTPSTDQRGTGFARVVDGNNDGTAICDKGAYELAAPAAITATKSFSPGSVEVNGTSTLSIVLGNPNTGLALTGVAITDNFPAGMRVAATPGASTTCGGSVTAAVGGGSVSLTGGTIPAGGSCSITVSVQGVTAGQLLNRADPATSVQAPASGNATATLIVTAGPVPTATPTATPTPVFVQNYVVTPVIPVFQNPSAGAFFNPIAKTPTPRAQVQAVQPATFDPAAVPVLRPPNTGDAGLKAIAPGSDE